METGISQRLRIDAPENRDEHCGEEHCAGADAILPGVFHCHPDLPGK